jgi:CBS domain containing-hemolysin-like protein
VEDSPDHTTAAGFVITALGAIPTAGSSVTRDGHRGTVVETDGPRLRKIRIERV